jgi:osmoprotectant transport system ATP-binding protein
MTPPAIRAGGVTKRFGEILALDGVDLHLETGRCLALVGESGSGKTTLLHCFNRLVVPDRGEVEVGGRAVSGIPPERLRRGIGYVPQHGGLLPHWTVLQNVSLVPRLLDRTDAEERARVALRQVGLDPDDFGERWPRRLSGGQRQRVALARALADAPDLVLLDEPFGALDALTRTEVQGVFASLRRERDFSAVLVTHDLGEAFRLADEVAVMRRGKILQVAAPDELRRAPDPGYVAALLDRAGVVS